MQFSETTTERRITLNDPLAGPEGPITELTIRPITRCDIGTRLRNSKKPFWRVSRMTGVAPEVLAGMSERDRQALLVALSEMAASQEASIAALATATIRG